MYTTNVVDGVPSNLGLGCGPSALGRMTAIEPAFPKYLQNTNFHAYTYSLPLTTLYKTKPTSKQPRKTIYMTP